MHHVLIASLGQRSGPIGTGFYFPNVASFGNNIKKHEARTVLVGENMPIILGQIVSG